MNNLVFLVIGSVIYQTVCLPRPSQARTARPNWQSSYLTFNLKKRRKVITFLRRSSASLSVSQHALWLCAITALQPQVWFMPGTQQVQPTVIVSISIKNDKLSAATDQPVPGTTQKHSSITLSLYRAGAIYEDLSSEHLSGLSLVSQLAVVLLWFSFMFFILHIVRKHWSEQSEAFSFSSTSTSLMWQQLHVLCSAGTTPRKNMMIQLQLDDFWTSNNVKDVVVNFCLLNLQSGSVPARDARLLWGSVTGHRFKTHVNCGNLVHWKSEKLILVNRTNFPWFPGWLSIETLTESRLSFFMDFCKPGFVDLWPLGGDRNETTNNI